MVVYSLVAISTCRAMDRDLIENFETTLHIYADKSEISVSSNANTTIRQGEEFLEFNDHKNVIVFNSDSGEKVIEYTGIAIDKNSERSWAKAIFEPKACSSKHFHKDRIEDYYITSALANVLVVVDGHNHFLKTGDHLRILANQQHQVFNLSETDPFSLVVKCTPSWIVEDHNLC